MAIDNTVLVHVDRQGFLEVKQGPGAVVLFVDERTMPDTILLLPSVNQMPQIDQVMHGRAMITAGDEASQAIVKTLQAFRLGLVRVEERRS